MPWNTLSIDRQNEIRHRRAAGEQVRHIARDLCVSPATVRQYTGTVEDEMAFGGRLASDRAVLLRRWR